MRTIGFIRSLEYYHLQPQWEVLCRKLGLGTVSVQPSRNGVAASISRFEHELCYPVKYYLAQVEQLLSRDDVDYLFIPILGGLKPGIYGCTKWIMLLDLVLHYFPSLATDSRPGLVSPRLWNQYGEADRFKELHRRARELAEQIGIDGPHVDNAVVAARTAQLTYEQNLLRTTQLHHQVPHDCVLEPEKPEECVLLLGHKYTLHDPVLNHGIVESLRRAGAQPVTKEHLWQRDSDTSCRSALGFSGDVFFAEGAELFNAAARAVTDPRIRGILYLSHFHCGFDAVIEGLIGRRILDAKPAGKPYLSIVLDEHTSKANTATKVEVFLQLVQDCRRGHAQGE